MGTASLAIEELRLMVPVLKELGTSLGGKRIRFSLFSALDSQDARTLFSHIPGVEFDSGPPVWTKFEEVPGHISKFDISIMPLRDTIWNRSKCATKILESMSMGIPVVASNVGENKHVVHHGRDGFLASSSKDWVEALKVLIEDESLRKSMGASARKYVVEEYDVSRIAEIYASPFKHVFADAV
jgi:glycosyltransferase involved in cell wall biosynthesis